MKYIVGAGIGGLFGLSVPMMMDTTQQTEIEIVPRQEDFQPVEGEFRAPIDNAMHLPDKYCVYIKYTTDDIEEQAKECLNRAELAIPAI